jgi:hypothetical protein
MLFHVVGVACVLASLHGGVRMHPACFDFESPTDYPSILECRQAADKKTVPIPPDAIQKMTDQYIKEAEGRQPDRIEWIVLHCAQVPPK